MSALLNNENDDDSFEEELETLQSLYGEEITMTKSPITVSCSINIDTNYIIKSKFTKKQNDITISVSNDAKCSERYSKKILDQIKSNLYDICKEESDSMPIYQCISYLKDSLTNDIEILSNGNKSKSKNTTNDKENKNDQQDDEDDEDDEDEEEDGYGFIPDKKSKKNKKNDNKNNNNNCNGKLITIYTWGNKIRKRAPIQSQHNTNVCGVTGYKPKGVNLKQLNGRDERIQKYVRGGKNYEKYLNNLMNKIVKESLHTISINCHKGRHRSVAFAECFAMELRKIGYSVNVIHMEIS